MDLLKSSSESLMRSSRVEGMNNFRCHDVIVVLVDFLAPELKAVSTECVLIT